MQINIKATGVELTPALSSYVEDKLSLLDKLVENIDGALLDVEIGKITHHHKTGNWFFAEANLKFKGKLLRKVSEEADLYAAIDKMKDGLAEEIRKYHRKQSSLVKKGGRALKKLFFRL